MIFFSQSGSSEGDTGSGDEGSNEGDIGDTTIDYSSTGVFSWISQGLTGIIESITQGVINQDNFHEYYKEAHAQVVENNKSILEKLGDILSYINPFSDNFFVYKLIDLLGELLEFLFIPSDDSIKALTDSVSGKFGFVGTIQESIQNLESFTTDINSSAELSVEVKSKYFSGDVRIIDLSWYAPFKPYGDMVITAFCYLLFLWRIYVHLPNIINATGGEVISIDRISGGDDK